VIDAVTDDSQMTLAGLELPPTRMADALTSVLDRPRGCPDATMAKLPPASRGHVSERAGDPVKPAPGTDVPALGACRPADVIANPLSADAMGPDFLDGPWVGSDVIAAEANGGCT
jgi:hypothetical protein